MIATFIVLAIAIAIRIAFGYVEIFAPALPYLTGICIAFGVLLGILIIVKIVKEIKK